jgi:hypothetical protein
MSQITIDIHTRDKMILILGQLQSLSFPLMWASNQEHTNTAYYDLIDSIINQYTTLLTALIGYKE